MTDIVTCVNEGTFVSKSESIGGETKRQNYEYKYFCETQPKAPLDFEGTYLDYDKEWRVKRKIKT